jgi:hypothetical protein
MPQQQQQVVLDHRNAVLDETLDCAWLVPFVGRWLVCWGKSGPDAIRGSPVNTGVGGARVLMGYFAEAFDCPPVRSRPVLADRLAAKTPEDGEGASTLPGSAFGWRTERRPLYAQTRVRLTGWPTAWTGWALINSWMSPELRAAAMDWPNK